VRSLPIRLRLTLAFAAVMALVLSGMGLFVYARVGKALGASIDQALTSQASEASRHASEGRNLLDSDVDGGATLAEVVGEDGSVSRSDPANLPLLIPAKDLAKLRTGSTVRGAVTLKRPVGDWRYLAVPSEDGVVVVARSLEGREESLRRLLRELLLAGPLALILASFAGYGLAAAALRPVEAMRRRAEDVSAHTPGRLPVPAGGDEISRLATTLNDMLGRLEAAFEHERQFVSNASHELRTPLAMLRTELDLALRRPRTQAELEEALRSAAHETNRLSELAEDLLLIARVDQGALPIRAERLAVEELFGAVTARFTRLAEDDRRSIDIRPSDAAVFGDRARVEQALANLVENALTYGGGAVDVYSVARDDVVDLHVVDSGPGFPPGFLDRAFDRFTRADESRTGGGSGLGLSIVALIAQAHGGSAAAVNRPEGGADVWLSLPRARAEKPAEVLI
jgi:two-component system OmpR family sensor kinase